VEPLHVDALLDVGVLLDVDALLDVAVLFDVEAPLDIFRPASLSLAN
jgi:hypothetical protein